MDEYIFSRPDSTNGDSSFSVPCIVILSEARCDEVRCYGPRLSNISDVLRQGKDQKRAILRSAQNESW